MSSKSTAGLTKSTSAKRATDSNVLGSAKSVVGAMGEKNSIVDDLESLHVPVGEQEDHNEEEEEEEDALEVSQSDVKATTPGYSAFARKNNKSNKNGPNDWLNLPKIRRNNKKKKKGNVLYPEPLFYSYYITAVV